MAGADDVDAAEPRRAESTAVVLARMEGKLDLANERLTNQAERVGSLETRVTDHDSAFEQIRLDHQQARADLEKHIATEAAAVAAVRAAKDEEVRDAARRWSPAARWSTGLMTAAAVAEGFYYALHR